MSTPKRGRTLKEAVSSTSSTRKRSRDDDQEPVRKRRRLRPETNLILDNDLVNLELNFVNILRKLFKDQDNSRIIRYLKMIGVFAKSFNCVYGSEMTLKRNETKLDKWVWVCNRLIWC